MNEPVERKITRGNVYLLEDRFSNEFYVIASSFEEALEKGRILLKERHGDGWERLRKIRQFDELGIY